jgi:hypothetical protein
VNSDVENTRAWFDRIYLGGIPLMINDETAFLSFICALTAVEALAGYRYTEPKPGERFRLFVESYLPDAYRSLSTDLWVFRNGMIHGFSPRRFALTHHNSRRHLESTATGETILNAEDFYAALLHAARRYFDELSSSEQLVANFSARLASDQGGTLSVGPVVIIPSTEKSG